MPDRAQWTDPHCPTARAADIIGDRWSLLIVRDAFDGSSRFSQFQRNLGIAKNILTDRLKVLVEQESSKSNRTRKVPATSTS